MNNALNLESLHTCFLCPRRCGVNRIAGQQGYCKSEMLSSVSSVCIHRGEEPVISGENGICNVFFAHCNLQCVYCQNHQISCNKTQAAEILTTKQLSDRIIPFLDSGIDMLGFVSPTHFSVQMVEVIRHLHDCGYYPTIIYNSNGYDSIEVISQLADYIDVYLPDFKYFDNILGQCLSDVPDYFNRTMDSLTAMYQQKSSKLLLDHNGLVRNGIIIRHLILPGHLENSKNVLKAIASLDRSLHISLMAQYYPPFHLDKPELNRVLKGEEYEEILDFMDEIGIENGWIQELESAKNYQPDFDKPHPFE